MAKEGDSYRVELKKTHIEWGVYRHTDTRDIIYGEGYIKIPADVARSFNITNSNSDGNYTYKCSSEDGFLKDEEIIASGSSREGCIYAKQFQGKGNLKLLGSWYEHINAQAGDIVEVRFISSAEIMLRKV